MTPPPPDVATATADTGAPPVARPQRQGKGSGADARPPDYKDDEKILQILEQVRQDAAHNPARQERDSFDLLNHGMYRGGPKNHWVHRNTTTGFYEERPYDGADGLPQWVPRCVTNVFATKIDGLISLLVRSDPARTARPATDDDEDQAAAEVADKALPVLADEIDYLELKRRMSHLICLSDKCAIILYYDTDPKHGTEDIPLFECQACKAEGVEPELALHEAMEVDKAQGLCPACGSDQIAEALGPDGTAIGLTYSKGKLSAELATSFEFSLPSSATTTNTEKLPWVYFHNDMEIQTACRTWHEKAALIRQAGEAAGKHSTSRTYARQLQQMSSPTSTRAQVGSGGSDRAKHTVYVERVQHDPIVDETFNFPEGLYAVVIGDQVIDAGPLPVLDRATGYRRKSVLVRTYRELAGTAFGKPPADDLVPLQMQRNLLETLAFLTDMHHAAPMVFLPLGVTLEDELTGMPGGVYRYRSLDPQARPSVERGTGVTASVDARIDRIDAKMDELSGLNGVLQGARPKTGGTPTLGEVQILQEQGMAQQALPLQVAVDFEAKFWRLALDIARETMWSPRYRRVMGDDGQWETSQFAAADLQGNVDIVIEAMSAWPKSPMMQQMRVKEAVALGIINPAMDPEVATKLLEEWGLEDLKASISEDHKQIRRELDRWRAAVSPMQIEPPDVATIEVPIHLHYKKQFLKSEQAEQIKAANPPVYQAMAQHVAMLAMALAPPPMPAPGPGEKGGGPPDGSAVEDAVKAGVLVPEGAQPAPPDPMEGLVQAGALTPEGAMQPTGPSIDELMAQQVLRPVAPEGQGPAPPA